MHKACHYNKKEKHGYEFFTTLADQVPTLSLQESPACRYTELLGSEGKCD